MSASRSVRSISTPDPLWDEVILASKREGVSMSAIVNRALQQFFTTQVARSSWDTDEESSWYDERKFYTYSEDKKGHSIQIRLWIPKNLAGQIGRVVNSGQIPEYRSAQDFYRDSMFHRAHVVSEWLDDGELIADEDEIAQLKKDAEVLIAATRENLEEAWNRGDHEWMETHINQRLEKATSVPELFRAEYVRLLKGYQARLKEVDQGNIKRMPKRRAESANE
jgi:hypothetical protein